MFFRIVNNLRARLERSATRMREAVPVEERVAVALWYLANGICYRVVGEQFGLAKSTVGDIVVEVCLAMEMELLGRIICPGPPRRAMLGFAALGFLHCISAMDGCHVQIRAPPRRSKLYINRKHAFSVVLQAMRAVSSTSP